MSYLGHAEHDLRFPPPPVQISRADRAEHIAWEPRFTFARRPGLGAVQEASLVGIVALALAWAMAELALLLFG